MNSKCKACSERKDLICEYTGDRVPSNTEPLPCEQDEDLEEEEIKAESQENLNKETETSLIIKEEFLGKLKQIESKIKFLKTKINITDWKSGSVQNALGHEHIADMCSSIALMLKGLAGEIIYKDYEINEKQL